MKKNVKAIFAGLAAAALLAGFSSCSNGSSDDSLNKPAGTSSGANQIDTNNDEVFSGDLITYVISVASTDSENTKLILQYDRSAAGAKEQISLTDADLALTVNGAAVDTPKTITFALDAYSSFEKEAGKEETDASKQKTYKCTIDLKKQLSVNDKVTLQLNKAKVTGEGASSVKLGSIVATIVDIAPAANYWKELSETKYQTLITKKNGADLNATVAVEEPANPTPANNTPENPAPANPTPENPTPATPENPATDTNNTTPAANALTKTSILSGIQAGDNVWGSGTKTTQNSNGTYNVIAAGANEGGWGGNIAAVPVCFAAGDLTGFTHIVLEADLSTFNLGGSDEYPGIELKVAKGENENEVNKIINATTLFNNGKAEISLSSVDFLDTAEKIIISFRGTGSLTVNDISKAK